MGEANSSESVDSVKHDTREIRARRARSRRPSRTSTARHSTRMAPNGVLLRALGPDPLAGVRDLRKGGRTWHSIRRGRCSARTPAAQSDQVCHSASRTGDRAITAIQSPCPTRRARRQGCGRLHPGRPHSTSGSSDAQVTSAGTTREVPMPELRVVAVSNDGT